jgi:hypothetical protein
MAENQGAGRSNQQRRHDPSQNRIPSVHRYKPHASIHSCEWTGRIHPRREPVDSLAGRLDFARAARLSIVVRTGGNGIRRSSATRMCRIGGFNRKAEPERIVPWLSGRLDGRLAGSAGPSVIRAGHNGSVAQNEHRGGCNEKGGNYPSQHRFCHRIDPV